MAVKILNEQRKNRGDLKESIFHNDRGTQYASKTKLVQQCWTSFCFRL